MDPKALKAALKSAREGVKAKNYTQVHRVAQEILAADPKNYHGLVFLGISLPEVDSSAIKRAVDAFKEAAEVGPDQPLAWQGLATLYEKNPIKVCIGASDQKCIFLMDIASIFFIENLVIKNVKA